MLQDLEADVNSCSLAFTLAL